MGDLNSDDLEGAALEEESEEDAARRGARQITYDLYPSRQYVLYIACKNAERTWAKGANMQNKGCLEVQIAILTERIRNSVMHVREFKHDFVCRRKLASKDLDAYMKVREELQIRHVYRMEALIGRLDAYKYSMSDRKRAPGRKTVNRLKKTKRLLQRRLASQLRQGKPRRVIHKTESKMNGRRWATRAYDDVKYMLKGKPTETFIDPLALP